MTTRLAAVEEAPKSRENALRERRLPWRPDVDLGAGGRPAAPISLATAAPAAAGVALLVAVATWTLALRGADIGEMNGLGLVSILPPEALAALALVAAAFTLALATRSPKVVGLGALVVLVFVLFGATTLVEDIPRFDVTWRHIGVTDYVLRHGSVDPNIDAYFNWPGFFILSAFLTELAGAHSLLWFTPWAPIVFNLLYLGPVLMLYRAATRDWRVVLLAVWLFYAANWIGQDYFAPQALAYFFHLTVLAVVVTWFLHDGVPPRPVRALGRLLRRLLVASGARSRGRSLVDPACERPRDPGRGRRVFLAAAAIGVFAVIVPSHQLTPFMTIVGVGGLVALNLCSLSRLPLLMIVLTAAWISFMASAYLGGHLDTLTSQVGELEQTVAANVGSRITGSPEHRYVVYARLALTGGLWLLAVLGAIRSSRAGRLNVAYGVLGVAPFVLLPLQPYGGEILLRAYLFALPFVAFFAASFFFPTPAAGRSRLTAAVAGVAGLAVLIGCLVARYGNEQMDYFTHDETAGIERLYDLAEPGSLLVAGSANLPWKYRDYEEYDYATLTSTEAWSRMTATSGSLTPVVQEAARLMRREPDSAYLIITRSQKAEVDLLGVGPPGSLDQLEDALAGSRNFRVVYATEDASIFALASSPPGES
ncbi:MAG: hypothetical protein M3377_05905 [Actinomycetota bacterium]|nr:hypothetical protein [Actinomycetota bacterium]